MSNQNEDAFVKNLPRIYGLYTGAFVVFVLILAVLEQVGIPDRIIGYVFMFMTIAVYAAIGIISRTARVSQYYVAGRQVPPVFNGMATASDWMSGASFVGMAGSLYLLGYDGLAFVLGWTGGYVLVAVLLAPYLRKFGAFTVPDFLGSRYDGNFARVIGIIVLMACSITYVTAQIYATGIITSRFTGIQFEVAVFFGLFGILVCSMLGGMRGVTWTQVAQYIILIIAYLIPVIWLSTKVTGFPIPQLTYGSVLDQITTLEAEQGVEKSYVAAFTNYTPFNFFALIFCLMLGTASLPHVLMRFFTTPSVKAARLSVGWALLFIFLLYFTAPAYAAFARYEILSNVVGNSIASLPSWVSSWGDIGLVSIDDANADGILQFSEFTINRDVVVLATPEIAGLPYVIAGLVAAGGLAAALSTADGLLLAIANALSHDIYFKMINPEASTRLRLIVARTVLIFVAIFAAWLASTRPSDILSMVAWAFSIAASGLFAPLVLGVWWKRANKQGAIAGMLSGFILCCIYLFGTKYGGMALWFNVPNISAGVFGIPVSFVVMVVVSLLTEPPSEKIQTMVDNVRIPAGTTMTGTDDSQEIYG
ncbi:cation/acetate symporter ActP [Spirochaetota bacterium]|nr:cation/acetate symporter ActP [Spirochaetota bacterium]